MLHPSEFTLTKAVRVPVQTLLDCVSVKVGELSEAVVAKCETDHHVVDRTCHYWPISPSCYEQAGYDAFDLVFLFAGIGPLSLVLVQLSLLFFDLRGNFVFFLRLLLLFRLLDDLRFAGVCWSPLGITTATARTFDFFFRFHWNDEIWVLV